MNILFVLPSLNPGGAERVVSFLARKFYEDDQNVELLILGKEKKEFYETGNLPVYYLNRSRLLFSVWEIVSFIKARKPDIVFSSIGQINIFMGIISCFFKKTRFIAREASVVSERARYGDNKSRLLSCIARLSYKNLDAIVCQCEDIRVDLSSSFNIEDRKLHIIGNPITMRLSEPNMNGVSSLGKVKFITVGRLSEVKGHSRIILGLSKIKTYDFHYTLVGNGPLRRKIEEEIEGHNLKDKVTFIKYTSKVLEEIAKNDYFLQGSFVEGFPNAVLESCSIGVPVIAFNCPGGTRDIIGEKSGYLIENQSEFESLLVDLHERKKFAKNPIIDSVFSKYEAEYIIGKYKDVFLGLLRN
jgi:glycosyltransferase involved in cell wall biosynthesis